MFYKLFYYCDNSGSNLCRAVRAMNEKLKQNRLLREQGDDSSLSHSPNERISSADLQKNVGVNCSGNHGVCYYLNCLSQAVASSASAMHHSGGLIALHNLEYSNMVS